MIMASMAKLESYLVYFDGNVTGAPYSYYVLRSEASKNGKRVLRKRHDIK